MYLQSTLSCCGLKAKPASAKSLTKECHLCSPPVQPTYTTSFSKLRPDTTFPAFPRVAYSAYNSSLQSPATSIPPSS
ncbi:hypothetical protein CGCF413_v001895 [Colletotrichum fructicola]|nr:hypothetical protein CFRS1_v013532 [Colletotrichum fructicola]KAF5513336.1 hypothetical protein CGCF413_v001895 [Colletotrichum fructicola]